MSDKITFEKFLRFFVIAVLYASILFASITRASYTYSSRDASSELNASLPYDEAWAHQFNLVHADLSYEAAREELEKSSCVFYAECSKRESAYGCTKYKMNVIKTIRGDCDETSNDIVLYQFAGFDYSDGNVSFLSQDNSMLLKEGKKYLLFAEKRNYHNEYQKTLNENEYSLNIAGALPSALVVGEEQSEYIDISKAKKYGDIEHLYYACFDEPSLRNINEITQMLIKDYIY